MYYCSVIYLTCQISIIVSAEEYLQSESPEDKRRREESACLLGEYKTLFKRHMQNSVVNKEKGIKPCLVEHTCTVYLLLY